MFCCSISRRKMLETRATEILLSTLATRTILRGRRWASTASTETASDRPPTAAEATGLRRTCRRRRDQPHRSSTRTGSLVTSPELRAANLRLPMGNLTASLRLLALPIRQDSRDLGKCHPLDTLPIRMVVHHQDLYQDSLQGHQW